MIRRMICLVPLVVLVPVIWAAPQAPQVAKPAPAVQAVTDDAVVRLLGETITEKQVLAAINQLAIRAQQAQQVTPQQLQQKDTFFYKDALDTLMGGMLLKSEAQEKKIIVDKAKVDTSFQSVKGQFPTDDAFQKALKEQGMNEAELRKSIEDNLVIQQVLDEVLKTLPMTSDQDIQKFYDDNPQFFEEPEQARVAHIYLKAGVDAKPEQRAALKKKLEGLRDELESKKITFAEAAAKNSDDKESAQNGGDWGPIKRGEVEDVIEKAIFSTKPGTISPVVETETGFHLLSVTEYKALVKTPIATVKPRIQQYLEQKSKQDAVKQHVDGLKAKVKIETLITDEEWVKRHTIK